VSVFINERFRNARLKLGAVYLPWEFNNLKLKSTSQLSGLITTLSVFLLTVNFGEKHLCFGLLMDVSSLDNSRIKIMKLVAVLGII
jgi:hypothetical protein